MRSIVAIALVLAAAGHASAAGVLDQVPVGATVAVPGFTVAGKSTGGDVTLRRIEVRAPGARTWLVRANGKSEALPPDGRHWFISDDSRFAHRLVLALDPRTDRVTGSMHAGGEVTRFEGRNGKAALEITASAPLPQPGNSSCVNEQHAMEVGGGDANPLASLVLTKGTAQLHEAVVAIETDSEFLSQKFGGNATNAQTYLDDLFAEMTAIFERDLDVRVLRGDTFLYAGADQWDETTPSTQLTEVGRFWKDTASRQAIDRTFVMFLSGKGAPNSASGIAWVLTSGNWCALTGTVQGSQVTGHYSATQVFHFDDFTAPFDVGIVAHELGHNFGAHHSHCTNQNGTAPSGTNTVDQCFSGETAGGTACYSGPTSCPNDNSLPNGGSLMSYCHGIGGADCANGSLNEFHPVHQGILDLRVATNISAGCLTEAAGVPVDRVFYSGFEN